MEKEQMTVLNDIEKAFRDKIAQICGPIPDGLGGYILDGDGNPIAGALPSTTVIANFQAFAFSLYMGESREEIRVPCCIINASNWEPDEGSPGNGFATVTIQTRFSVDPLPGEITDALKLGQDITKAIMDFMQLSSIEDEINAVAVSKLTLIGSMQAVSFEKLTDGNLAVHEVQRRIYCAQQDVR